MDFKVVKTSLERNSPARFLEVENRFYRIKISVVSKEDKEITKEDPDKYLINVSCLARQPELPRLFWSPKEKEVCYQFSDVFLFDNRQLDVLKSSISEIEDSAKLLKELIVKINKGEKIR